MDVLQQFMVWHQTAPVTADRIKSCSHARYGSAYEHTPANCDVLNGGCIQSEAYSYSANGRWHRKFMRSINPGFPETFAPRELFYGQIVSVILSSTFSQ